MGRLVTILLCACIAVVCALVGYLGFIEMKKSEDPNVAPTEITCQKLLEKVPAAVQFITLTDFQPGKHFVSYDDDNDGQWDRVFVPLFPSQMRGLGHNYNAVIVRFDDVVNKQQLDDRIESPSIQGQYWRYAQRLDRRTYSKMARDYSSMDFRRNVLLRSGMTQSSDRSRLMFFCSGIGLIGAILVGVWQAFALMLAGIKRQMELEVDDESKQITNRAGLPTLAGKGSAAADEENPSDGYTKQLITQKYLQP